jgi:hypothetical protein
VNLSKWRVLQIPINNRELWGMGLSLGLEITARSGLPAAKLCGYNKMSWGLA